MANTEKPKVRFYTGGIYEILSPVELDLGPWAWRYTWKIKYGDLLCTTLYCLYDRVHHTDKLNNYGQYDLRNIMSAPFYTSFPHFDTSFPHFDFLKGL